MQILFEQHQYEASLVQSVLKDICTLQDVDKKIMVNYVGYYYCNELNDCVFILPKVLLKDEIENGKKVEVIADVPKYKDEEGNEHFVLPEDIISKEGQNKFLEPEYRKFIYEFSVWIYRVLAVYRNNNKKSDTIYYRHLPEHGKGRRHKVNTFLDIILSLIEFNQNNHDFFLYTIKNIHSGINKINWQRTIAKSQCIIKKESPIYIDPINKKRRINFDEELFIIFFSILNNINNEYGFKTPINFQYELLNKNRFEQYKKGYGKNRLRQIKYKYFSDKTLMLWDLCYAFFDSSHKLSVNTDQKEYLLAKNFNIVFEAMVDHLIGTPRNEIPKGLKDQEDGKRVDHIYTDIALTSAENQNNREVYYIGDSKYYKRGHSLTSESIYKQYTYARNVIQWNINLFLTNDETAYDDEELKSRESDRSKFSEIHLQDAGITEGYDVIPNFFISAFVYGDHKYNAGENLIKHLDKDGKHCTKVSYQFPDRLFDRDTLFLSQYDVNFLYVLFLYARNKTSEISTWRNKIKELFREEIRSVIQDRYQIYAMRSKLGVDGELYLKQHFYELNGRVFQPYGKDREVYYAYARPKEEEKFSSTQEQYDELSKAFVIEKCNMGKDPKAVLKSKVEKELEKPIETSDWLTMHYLEKDPDVGILVGYYRSDAHLKWIMGYNNKGTLVYNVRQEVQGEHKRDGAHSAGFYMRQNVKFVILYTDEAETNGKYKVFHVKATTQRIDEERMREAKYPFIDEMGNTIDRNYYFFFRFDEEVNIGKLKFSKMLEDLKTKHFDEYSSYVEKEPMFAKAEWILKYKE